MTPLSPEAIRELIDRFKRMPLDQQCADLSRTYRDASQTILRVVLQMKVLTEMTQIMQDLQRAHGYVLPADLVAIFQEFTERSTTMADAWIANNAVVSRSIQLHNITIKQPPSFNL